MSKSFNFLAVCSIVLVLCSCTTQAVNEPSGQYPLSKDELFSLLPYAVDFKQEGKPEVVDTQIVDPISGSIYCSGSTSQAFSFSIYVDDNGRPIYPPEKTGAVALRAPISVGGTSTCSGGSCTKISQDTECTACKTTSRGKCQDNCNAPGGCTQFNSCSTSAFGFSNGLIAF